jgi:broad specificity phosphatase PhoE
MSAISPDQPTSARKLYLLRHSVVASHRGDVPLTDEGREIARQAGLRLGASEKQIRLLYGSTLRARQTAESIAEGAVAAGAKATSPREAFALRNPDIYVAGERVNMVSSFEAVAEQVEGLSVEEATKVPFFRGFIGSSDRVGWWLREANPPGENAAAVAQRMVNFASSLADGPLAEFTTVAVTHSPILRACAMELLGTDPGEPEWVAGLLVEVDATRFVRMTVLPHAP